MNKKTAIILVGILLIASACNQRPNRTVSSENAIVVETKEESFDYCDISCKLNLLDGQIFRRNRELAALVNWTSVGGSLIDTSSNDQDVKFAIGHYIDENENAIVTLEKLLYGALELIGFKVLDAINVGKLNENELLQAFQCRLNMVYDNEIIAVVIWESDKEFFDKVIRAWRADTKTGKIKEIDIEGIDCENIGFHV